MLSVVLYENFYIYRKKMLTVKRLQC